jgi:RimJ/RimL family protein N-acetyltransferase
MTYIDVKQDHFYIWWASQRLNGLEFPKDAKTIAVKANAGMDSPILAVIVFSRWTPHNVELSIATDGCAKWYSRRLLDFVLHYAFQQCGKARITACVELGTSKSIRLCDALFRREGQLQNWFGKDRHGVVYGWTEDEWQQSKYGGRRAALV